jgi:hypothetical protein
MKTLFSINRAADLLERDRQTLVRALRHVKGASATLSTQDRWIIRKGIGNIAH